MTIASLKAQGVTGIRVWCIQSCPRMEAKLIWEQVGLPDDADFADVRRKRFVCRVCGRLGEIMPAWSGMQERDRAERAARPWP